MSVDENKAVIRRWMEAHGARDVEAAVALWKEGNRDWLIRRGRDLRAMLAGSCRSSAQGGNQGQRGITPGQVE